ncbi:hypothetical protein AGR8A_Cc70592 [Agrobacterium fabrum str. J-07]|nr:hypothetical protein AGR8A_Cc70592 [Agrobacterium fabrum str. J-07]
MAALRLVAGNRNEGRIWSVRKAVYTALGSNPDLQVLFQLTASELLRRREWLVVSRADELIH